MQKILYSAALILSLTAAMQAVAAEAPTVIKDPKQAPAGTFIVEPAHTHAIWFINHLGFSHYSGQFTDIGGKLDYNPKALEKSKVNVVIKTGSIDVPSDLLENELKGEKFFNTDEFPDMTFASTSLVPVDQTHGKVTGNLTLLGVTKPITLDVTFNGSGLNPITKQPVIGFDAVGTIKRSDFGMTAYIPMVGDDVRLDISAEFVPVPATPGANIEKGR